MILWSSAGSAMPIGRTGDVLARAEPARGPAPAQAAVQAPVQASGPAPAPPVVPLPAPVPVPAQGALSRPLPGRAAQTAGYSA